MPDVYRRTREFRGEIPLVRDFFDMSGAPIGKGELIQRSPDKYDAVVDGHVYSVRLTAFGRRKVWTRYSE